MFYGWIKLFRRLAYSSFWLSEKFSRPQAFVDLLLLSNHAGGYIRKRGIKIMIARGEVGYSEIKLSERWKWSRGKTRRFLQELVDDKKIELRKKQQLDTKTVQQISNVTSVVRILNYELYQGNNTTNKPTDKPADKPTDEHQTVPEQECIELKECESISLTNPREEKNTNNSFEKIKEYFFCKRCHEYAQTESDHVLTFCKCEKLDWGNIENIVVFPGEKIEDKIQN